jgi:hypothetical protein
MWWKQSIPLNCLTWFLCLRSYIALQANPASTIPHDPTHTTLGIYPRGCKAPCKTALHTLGYCSTIYLIQTVELAYVLNKWWMNKGNVVFIPNAVSFTINMNEILLFSGKFLQVEIIMLRKMNQAQMSNFTIFHSCGIFN